MLQRIIHSLLLRLALMLLELRLELLPGLLQIEQELLSRPEGQPADIAIGQARNFADESCDLKVSLCHGNIMAGA